MNKEYSLICRHCKVGSCSKKIYYPRLVETREEKIYFIIKEGIDYWIQIKKVRNVYLTEFIPLKEPSYSTDRDGRYFMGIKVFRGFFPVVCKNGQTIILQQLKDKPLRAMTCTDKSVNLNSTHSLKEYWYKKGNGGNNIISNKAEISKILHIIFGLYFPLIIGETMASYQVN
jgi:hypothetical protein